jgi:hypothetical protein
VIQQPLVSVCLACRPINDEIAATRNAAHCGDSNV